jgi:hypothetical protein
MNWTNLDINNKTNQIKKLKERQKNVQYLARNNIVYADIMKQNIF